MIELKHVSKVFETAGGRVEALKDISLTIPDGDVYGIIGMSGAGKSTLVRCINMLERPTSGEVIVNGKRLDTMSPAQLRAARRDITMIFQRFNLLMQRNCLDNVCFPMELAGVSRREAASRAQELLETVGLPDKAKAYPAQLSGGQQQRVALARILCSKPKAILLDEPFSALDGFLKWNLELELSDLLSRFNGPIVWVSHDLGECRRNCSQVCVMENGLTGRIMGLDELIRRPDSLSAARLAGYKNFFPCRACEGGVFVPDWGLTLRGISAGPEHSLLAVGPDAVDLSGKAYAFRVLRVIQDVGHNVVLLRPDGASENAPVLRIEAAPENVPQPGSILTLSLRPASLLLF